MFIKEIRKKNKNKYEIKLDNDQTYILYEDVIIKYKLLSKKDIELDIKNILKDNEFYETYDYALNLINKRIRSEKEIRENLNKKNSKDIELVINKLKQINLINDSDFAKRYINDKINLSSYGLLKIKRDLLDYDISLNIIEKLLEEIDENIILEKLEKLIKKYTQNNKKNTKYQIKNKTLNYFINLGYEKDDILKIFDQLNIKTDENLIKKEYEKLIKKYKSKKEEKELQYFIINKLYQKGFTKEEINSLIE